MKCDAEDGRSKSDGPIYEKQRNTRGTESQGKKEHPI